VQMRVSARCTTRGQEQARAKAHRTDSVWSRGYRAEYPQEDQSHHHSSHRSLLARPIVPVALPLASS
jgi:hypothetical protein